MSEIPEDIRKAAREAFIEYANFSKHEAAEIAIRNVLLGGSDDMPMLELASRAIWAERQRAVEICAAEREFGGNIADAQGRIEKGDTPRQIEGWNCPYEEE